METSFEGMTQWFVLVDRVVYPSTKLRPASLDMKRTDLSRKKAVSVHPYDIM